MADTCKKIFFHSYKGGVGRTFLLANIAYELTKNNKKVGIVDLDYDAPGITNIILNSYKKKCAFENPDVIYLLNCYSPAEMKDSILEITNKLYILPTNTRQAPGAMDNFYRLVLDADQFTNILENIFSAFIQLKHLDYLLIDLRPGLTFLILPLALMANYVIQVFRPSNQDLVGTKILNDVVRARDDSTSILIPSFIPMIIKDYEKKFIDIIEKYIQNQVNYKYFLPVINELYLNDTILAFNRNIKKTTPEVKKYLETIKYIVSKIRN